MVRNIIYFAGSVIIFFAGMVVYGIILNTREITLKTAMERKNLSVINNAVIIINRQNHQLHLYNDTTLVKTYKAVLGRSHPQSRMSLKNNVTPVGKYNVCEIDTSHEFHKFFRINHPNLNDATEALREGLISASEFNEIRGTYGYNACPEVPEIFTQSIGIHGTGEYNFIFKNLPFIFDWTNGSVAVSNEEIDELYSVVSIGTEVIIK